MNSGGWTGVNHRASLQGQFPVVQPQERCSPAGFHNRSAGKSQGHTVRASWGTACTSLITGAFSPASHYSWSGVNIIQEGCTFSKKVKVHFEAEKYRTAKEQ